MAASLTRLSCPDNDTTMRPTTCHDVDRNHFFSSIRSNSLHTRAFARFLSQYDDSDTQSSKALIIEGVASERMDNGVFFR
jgi:hypothetical protein